MKRWLAIIGLVVALSPLRAQAATVTVRGSTLAVELERALSVELGEGAVTDPPADFVALLLLKGDVLELTVKDAQGTQVIERELGAQPGPAVRVATLLIAQAVRSPTPLPRPTIVTAPPLPPPRPFTGTSTVAVRAPPWITGVRFGASLALLGFGQPSTPRPGVGLAAQLGIRAGPIVGFFGAGLAIGAGERTTNQIAASLLELHVSGELGVRALSLGVFEIYGIVGGGTSLYSGEARALVFAGNATSSPLDPAPHQASLWLLLEARYAVLGALDVWLRGGARVSSRASAIELPPTFGPTEAPVEVGTLVPWAALGLGWTFGR